MSIPKFGCINVHPSLLPRWRGAAPIQRSIEAGDELTGITIMKMNEGLDTGDIIYQEPIPIDDNDSSKDMHNKFITLGIDSLLLSLDSILENNFMLHPQDGNLATYAKKIKKDEAKINWENSAKKIHKKIMAFNAWPVAETILSGERIRIHDSEYKNLSVNGIPGTIKSTENQCIEVFTKNGLLLIKKLQKNNSKVLDSNIFINSVDLKGKKFE
jgi:methionyl-tRNA formyltransferase